MKANLLLLLPCCFSLTTCQTLEDKAPAPTPKNWGPNTYQVDVVHEKGSTYFYVQVDDRDRLHHSFHPTPAEELPFRFYDEYFQNYREIMIASPYPIRANWFRVTAPDCLDPGHMATGIEFAITTARENDYLLIARLDSTYWNCLKASGMTNSPSLEKAGGRLSFSFQLLQIDPVAPTPFTLHGFYNQEQKLVHLKAYKDHTGTWRPTVDYQEPGPSDITVQITKHPQLGTAQSLLRISSTMLLAPQSVWIGLRNECLDQADWEVHSNRHNDRFLLDIVLPDCYLDCLNQVADGFEFEVDFIQYSP